MFDHLFQRNSGFCRNRKVPQSSHFHTRPSASLEKVLPYPIRVLCVRPFGLGAANCYAARLIGVTLFSAIAMSSIKLAQACIISLRSGRYSA